MLLQVLILNKYLIADMWSIPMLYASYFLKWLSWDKYTPGPPFTNMD